jgi:hypothetical protein
LHKCIRHKQFKSARLPEKCLCSNCTALLDSSQWQQLRSLPTSSCKHSFWRIVPQDRRQIIPCRIPQFPWQQHRTQHSCASTEKKRHNMEPNKAPKACGLMCVGQRCYSPDISPGQPWKVKDKHFTRVLLLMQICARVWLLSRRAWKCE